MLKSSRNLKAKMELVSQYLTNSSRTGMSFMNRSFFKQVRLPRFDKIGYSLALSSLHFLMNHQMSLPVVEQFLLAAFSPSLCCMALESSVIVLNEGLVGLDPLLISRVQVTVAGPCVCQGTPAFRKLSRVLFGGTVGVLITLSPLLR